MAAFLASFLLVTLAEMGDKTQLLVIAFASRYKSMQVFAGLFLGVLFNQALAVAAGRFLAEVMPMNIISLAAALSFIGFGIWTIAANEGSHEEKRALSKYGPVITVAMAFVLAELGDKTQLATVSLAVQYPSAFGVLLGSTFGMLAADTLGLVVGAVFIRKLPEHVIKYFAGLVFILFGVMQTYVVAVREFGVYPAVVIAVGLAAVVGAVFFHIKTRRKNNKAVSVNSEVK